MKDESLVDEIIKLLEAKHGTEETVIRRNNHIKWLWGCIGFIMTTGAGWIVIGTLWYAKMEHVARAVDQIYLKVFGFSMP